MPASEVLISGSKDRKVLPKGMLKWQMSLSQQTLSTTTGQASKQHLSHQQSRKTLPATQDKLSSPSASPIPGFAAFGQYIHQHLLSVQDLFSIKTQAACHQATSSSGTYCTEESTAGSSRTAQADAGPDPESLTPSCPFSRPNPSE